MSVTTRRRGPSRRRCRSADYRPGEASAAGARAMTGSMPEPSDGARLASSSWTPISTPTRTPTGRGCARTSSRTVDGAAHDVDGVTASLGGDADHEVFQLLRRLADVVMVGAGTARIEKYRSSSKTPLALVSRRLDVPERLVGPEPDRHHHDRRSAGSRRGAAGRRRGGHGVRRDRGRLDGRARRARCARMATHPLRGRSDPARRPRHARPRRRGLPDDRTHADLRRCATHRSQPASR